MTSSLHHHRLLGKLQSIAELTPEDTHAILALPMRAMNVRADTDIASEGDSPSRSCVIVEGFACRYKLTPPGKRQILAFHTSGDVPDLQSLYLKVLDHSLATVTPCKVAFVEHVDLHRLFVTRPTLSGVFWRDTLIDAAIFREWMTGLGRRQAFGRLSHLFCELSLKLRAVGLASTDRFPMPMTQAELGDALGLSTVHVNRTLSELKEQGFIAVENGSVRILDWDALSQAGEFDPTYLHLRPHAS